MGLETEVKISLEAGELESFREFLDSIDAPTIAGRAPESNWLFDYENHSLSQSGCTIRLRGYGGKSVLTFKGRLVEDLKFKKRPEFQTLVSDGASMLEILAQLGLKPTFEYHKIRELRTWTLPEGTLEVALDETPVGIFVELEGPPEAIDAAASKMGWGVDRYSREGYVELYTRAGLGAVDNSQPGPRG